MYQLRVESEFSAAHFLSSYQGKCENLHGHNYRVRLWIRGTDLDQSGMLLDFSLLRRALDKVLETLDHKNLNDIPIFDNNPSAERIAAYIYGGIKDQFASLGLESTLIEGVDVFENQKSMARYTEPN
ncbi:MAG: 6-carboxytetrahydropterin synthase QueD [Treponema sp.]|nr:6-carboxytetrahydropterin synthase QueD [Treponema sp.]